MSEPRIDPELLAAFLDGMATPAEREEVLRLIAGSREAYAEFSEAAAIRGALLGDDAAVDDAGAESEERDAGDEVPAVVVPFVVSEHPDVTPAAPVVARAESSAASGRFRFVVPVVMLAAAVLTVVVMSRRDPGPDADVVTVAQGMRVTATPGAGAIARAAGPGWDAPVWPVTRSAAEYTSASGRAFRAGVRYAQLEVAAAAGDSAAVRSTVDALVTLLADVSGSGPIVAVLRATPAFTPTAPADARRSFASQLRMLLGDARWFDLGTWTGTAHIAVLSGNEAFFSATRSNGEVLRGLLQHADTAQVWQQTRSPLQRLLELEGTSRETTAERRRLLEEALQTGGR